MSTVRIKLATAIARMVYTETSHMVLNCWHIGRSFHHFLVMKQLSHFRALLACSNEAAFLARSVEREQFLFPDDIFIHDQSFKLCCFDPDPMPYFPFVQLSVLPI